MFPDLMAAASPVASRPAVAMAREPAPAPAEMLPPLGPSFPAAACCLSIDICTEKALGSKLAAAALPLLAPTWLCKAIAMAAGLLPGRLAARLLPPTSLDIRMLTSADFFARSIDSWVPRSSATRARSLATCSLASSAWQRCISAASSLLASHKSCSNVKRIVGSLPPLRGCLRSASRSCWFSAFSASTSDVSFLTSGACRDERLAMLTELNWRGTGRLRRPLSCATSSQSSPPSPLSFPSSKSSLGTVTPARLSSIVSLNPRLMPSWLRLEKPPAESAARSRKLELPRGGLRRRARAIGSTPGAPGGISASLKPLYGFETISSSLT
mmetsp:Transcript_20588/g.61384  ORF Transcript_20588/g.61384 Transcript_20588/m.61384 type:complete len:327 (-) Transcript_20588:1394-2374(-)